MIHHPYLIALALIKQEGKRYLPLGGKSLREGIDPMTENAQCGEYYVLGGRDFGHGIKIFDMKLFFCKSFYHKY